MRGVESTRRSYGRADARASSEGRVSTPTFVGGGGRAPAVRSAHEPDPVRRASVLVRSADRGSRARGHARADRRAQPARRPGHEPLVLGACGGGPRAAALRAPAVPFAAPAAYWL